MSYFVLDTYEGCATILWTLLILFLFDVRLLFNSTNTFLHSMSVNGIIKCITCEWCVISIRSMYVYPAQPKLTH